MELLNAYTQLQCDYQVENEALHRYITLYKKNLMPSYNTDDVILTTVNYSFLPNQWLPDR